MPFRCNKYVEIIENCHYICPWNQQKSLPPLLWRTPRSTFEHENTNHTLLTTSSANARKMYTYKLQHTRYQPSIYAQTHNKQRTLHYTVSNGIYVLRFCRLVL